jgi:glucose/arabinose dehydrogenase
MTKLRGKRLAAAGLVCALGVAAVTVGLITACGESESGSGSGGVSQGGASGAAGKGSGGGGAGGKAGSGGSGGGGGFDCSAAVGEPPALKLTELPTSGLERPVLAISPPGDTERLFVMEQAGVIHVIKNGAQLPTPFLDIEELVTRAGNEQGLLGLAFHPGYAQNGRFFVHYSARGGGGHSPNDAVIAEYTRSTGNPDQADTTEKVLLTQSDNESNHNGGSIEFSPKDGFLYIGFGDGGGAEDVHGSNGNGQALDTLLGKILRIDVDTPAGGKPYGIPAGNMTTGGALPEIFAYGIRNAWRMSFDACTGDLFIGDVGQYEVEEISVAPAGQGQQNFGWRLLEGSSCFNPRSDCDPGNQTVRPIAEYTHSSGCSVTGGYVYRGSKIPGLRGTYLYADYCSGRFWALRYEGGQAQNAREITSDLNSARIGDISSFGQDASGELYVTSFDGNAVFRIDPE